MSGPKKLYCWYPAARFYYLIAGDQKKRLAEASLYYDQLNKLIHQGHFGASRNSFIVWKIVSQPIISASVQIRS